MSLWSSLGDGAKAFTQALEKTGDVITSKAEKDTTGGQPQSEMTSGPEAPSSTSGSPSLSEAEQVVTTVDDAKDPPAAAFLGNVQAGWSSMVETTKTSLSKVHIPNMDNLKGGQQQTGEERGNSNQGSQHAQQFLGNFQAGWSSVVANTKASINKAQNVVEEQQARLTEKLNQVRALSYKRDPTLPLDVVALKDAHVVYLTDRLISLSHPALPSNNNSQITGERKLAAVGHMLQQRHPGQYLVWNISEVPYDTRIFDENVLTFTFPGSPSPPLGLMVKILISMEAWLQADKKNVAVVHCLTGKGRSSLVLAAFLCWMGQAGFGNMNAALQYISQCKKLTPEDLTIPSQRRYAQYIQNLLDGVKPSSAPLRLKRVVLSSAPRVTMGAPRTDDKNNDEDLMGCAPYVQVFHAGKLLHTAPCVLHFAQDENDLPFCQVADGALSFPVEDVVASGDVLIRARHVSADGKQRLSLFRAAVHTGYAVSSSTKVLRLKKSELDGACNDTTGRYPNDFFVDLIWENVDAAELAAMKKDQEEDSSENGREQKKGEENVASSYETTLHRKSRFWDILEERKKAVASVAGGSKDDKLFGPTIGRRRDFEKKAGDTQKDSKTGSAASGPSSALNAFRIGAELDFLPGDEIIAQQQDTGKKDSLMEALMGALGENHEDDNEKETEVVIFDNPTAPKSATSTAPVVTSAAAPMPTPEPTMVALPPVDKKPVEPTKPSAVAPAPAPAAGDLNIDDADVAALLADAELNLDDDVDALLKDHDVGDAALLDIDAELDDLENFLSS